MVICRSRRLLGGAGVEYLLDIGRLISEYLPIECAVVAGRADGDGADQDKMRKQERGQKIRRPSMAELKVERNMGVRDTLHASKLNFKISIFDHHVLLNAASSSSRATILHHRLRRR